MSKIAIFGSKLFYGLAANSLGLSQREENSYLTTNFSMKKLSAKKALEYATKALKFNHDYDSVIIEIGYFDMFSYIIHNSNKDIKTYLEDFEKNYETLINMFLENNISVTAFKMEKFCVSDAKEYIESNFNLEYSFSEEMITSAYDAFNGVIEKCSKKLNVCECTNVEDYKTCKNNKFSSGSFLKNNKSLSIA